jgi:hypothetical protein
VDPISRKNLQISWLGQQPQLSASLRRVAVGMAALIMLTSSFDIALILHLGGTFRFCQIISIMLGALVLLRLSHGVVIPVLGIRSLSIWLIFQIMFIASGDFWPKSVGYCLWLLLNLALVASFVQLFSDDLNALAAVVRWYVYSFSVIAVFGMVQFVLPLLGYESPLVTQWWIKDILARVNGFSYEPSYFGTYLLIGFVFVAALRRGKSRLVSRRAVLIAYVLSGIGIVISSSRMAIVFFFIDLLLYSLTPWPRFLRDLIQMRIVLRTARALAPSVLLTSMLAGVLLLGVTLLYNYPVLALMFLNGTGISDTAAHSVVQRESALTDTLAVFAEHPIVGRSLGGVSLAIAGLHGHSVRTFDDSKQFEGMNIFAEALAASGIIGILPFVWFVVATIRKPLRMAGLVAREYSVLLRALVRSLIFAWAILQFNQNMLRPYLWVHIALLATAYASSVRSLSPTVHERRA